VLTDFAFLEQKTAVVGVDHLIADFGAALKAVPADHQRLWQVLRVLDREAHNLRNWERAESPAFFAQQLYNATAALGPASLAEEAERRLQARLPASAALGPQVRGSTAGEPLSRARRHTGRPREGFR
jgi:hypothetical protein